MLKCPRCSKQYPDDVHVCPLDLTPLHADETVADLIIDPLLRRVFEGKYRLDERLGGGGMGTVYRATHLLIDRPVAIKVLSQRFVGDSTAKQRFRREARAAGRMHHPNAVSVTDFGATADGYLYIVMELLEGRTLRDLLAREAPLDVARVVSIMLQTCAAVSAAHDVGLIHRDLKPANIFIEQRSNTPAVVKVLDFGVAKFAVEEQADDDYQTLTQVGAIIGTPRYMSPEQCSGSGSVTPASDVYSLGIILYEMLSGVVPFNAETPLAIALRHVSEPPRPLREIVPDVPEKLEAIAHKALAKRPSDRFADANELRQAIFAAAQELGLEHGASAAAMPSLEVLRDAGQPSPSGRLVIDIGTLREARSSGVATAPVTDEPTRITESDTRAPIRREISRLNIGLADSSRRKRIYMVVALVLFLAILASVVVGGRWWRSDSVAGVSANPVATVSPTPTPEVSPSPSPAPSPKPKPKRRQKEPSTRKKIWDKVKGIFR
ncbi:MAG: protein kinase [Pyrinomonadaceae bacterium]